jgi:hypothetical protein
LRSNFSSSKLVRLLGDWDPTDAQASGMDFAERLSLWLNAFDAIGLQSSLQSIKAIDTVATATSTKAAAAWPARTGSVDEDLRQVRATLAKAIAQDLNRDGEADAGFAPYRQRHLELQRRMELAIAPLREHVRQALSQVSPRLRQLAALDGVLEQMLAPREQALLPAAAGQMERRFGQLRQAHEDNSWLDAFSRDWREALTAELDLRLEPVAGLVEAMNNESNYQQ